MVREYNGKEIEPNAVCCHCEKSFVWDEETGEIYQGKFVCPECYQHYYGNCNVCGELHKYEDMNDDIVCERCANG